MLDLSVLYPLPICVLFIILARRWKKSSLPYPPGPKGYPILGNVLDLPANIPIWESLSSLAKRQSTFGSFSLLRNSQADSPKGTDVLYLRLMGKDTVVLSSNKAISDLIEKRSNIYADRVSDVDTFSPHFPDLILKAQSTMMKL